MWRGRYSKSRLRRFRFRQRGFVLPLVMGMGLLMLLVAVTMTFRSQTQNTTASAQKASERSIAVAEVGLARMQDFFSRHRGLLRQNFPWAGATGLPLDALGCNSSNSAYAEANSLNSIVGVDGGQFQLVSYTAPTSVPGTGTLALRGDTTVGSEVKSQTQLRVSIPVSRSVVPASSPPELWAENYTFPGSGTQVLSTSGHRIIEAKCGTLSSSVGVGNRIAAGTVVSNPTQTLPTPLATPPGAYDLGNLTGSPAVVTRLPRAGDTVNGTNGEYIYQASINYYTDPGSSRLIVTPGQKVTLYLTGNLRSLLSLGGGSTTRIKIGHDCTDTDSPPDGMSNGSTIVTGCVPENFKIIGTSSTNEISFASRHTVGGGTNLQTTTEAVIIAPNATVTLGQNLYTTRFKGMIWAKTIDLSQGTTTVEPASVAWTILQPTLPPISPPGSVLPLSMDTFSKWERVNVP
ncbi:hypothetical protein RIF25_06300 [Thermosynechococcaceae cyanobacterium BACA0444]|uniref:Uncharacterized protein n=1 Tax=Pseudocalidococcus azoricus BACA0444 TaxID=2918990 RepID=A0AAE4FSB3_9CYAN|nr:hypothetical protein [Pseudocalidococcus azoricus]MDS3860417.1 hypothetical protein [Pseudocalidococcus azoricus BACA0444]